MSNNKAKAIFYDRKYRKGEEKIHDYKIKLLEYLPNRKTKVLDVGCGSGYFSKKVKERGNEVSGVDISKEAIKKLRARGIKGKAVDLDEGLPYEDESFDVVWCTDLIEHVTSPKFLLEEINRILRPGGRLLLSTCNSAYFIFRFLHFCGLTCSEIQHPLHLHFFSKKSLTKVIEESGFEIIDYKGRNTFAILPANLVSKLSFIPFISETILYKLLKLVGFNYEETLTRGPLLLFYLYSKYGVSFFSDAFLINVKKNERL